MMSEVSETQTKVNIVIQGGAMRVAYALGVLSTYSRSVLSDRVASFYCSSAGTIAALGYVSQDIDRFARDLLKQLSGHKFINPLRVWQVVDVDFLVDDVLSRLVDLDDQRTFEKFPIVVPIVESSTGKVTYHRIHAENSRNLLKATMALPTLYGVKVVVNGSKYVDGGIGDNLPIAEAIRSGTGNCSAVIFTKVRSGSSNQLTSLEKLAIRLDPRNSGPVRCLLMGNDLLGGQSAAWINDGRFLDHPILSVAPNSSKKMISRICRQQNELDDFMTLGAQDAMPLIDDIESALESAS